MDLFEIVGKLSIDGVDKAEKELGGVSEKGSKVGGILKGVGAGVLAVTGAVATGAVALVKSVSSSYGELQQSIGGVETLFKDSADKVIENANNAFKTAGISANDYMQQVTSFSASLLQAVGGDTKKACDTADMAIIDMADNANKMGTSIESIQNAYQGFAKQNYTMLDNLKLGYGGTKGEMERLLADASKISGIKYDISNLNDVYNAIHVIQGELGITGTTAKEAGETIQGSFGSLSGAWQNFMAGLGNPKADMEALVGDVANSLNGAINNITPVINNMVAVLPTVMDALIDTISSMLPTLIQTFTELITKVIDAIVALLPEFIPLAVDCIMTVVQALLDNLPLIINAGIQLIITLAQGIIGALPTLIPTVVNVVTYLVQTLIENIPLLIDGALQLINGLVSFLLDPEMLIQIIDAGIELLLSLVHGIIGAIPELIRAIPKIISAIVTVIISELGTIIAAAIEIIFALINGLMSAIPELVAFIPNIIIGIVNGLLNNLDKIILMAPQIILSLIKGLIGAIPQLIMAIPKIIMSIVNTFKSYDWGSIGRNIVQGLKDGISKMWSNLKSWFKNLFGDLIGIAKKILGIASPSKVFKELGGWTAEGFGEGFDDEFGDVRDDVENALDFSGTNINGVSIQNPMQKYSLDFNAQLSYLNDGFERLISLIGNYLPEISENSKKELSVSGDKLVLGISRKMDSQLGKLAIAKGRGNV